MKKTQQTKVAFVKNNDGMTATMLVNGKVRKAVEHDIPYIPSLQTDHRGKALFLLLTELGLSAGDVELSADENLYMVIESEKYLHNPYHVLESIEERLNA